MTTSRGIPRLAFKHKIANPEVRQHVTVLVASGQLSVPDTAARYGISAATVRRCTAEFGADR
ncbi:hypothetical protein [Mycobacteroides abscessus]|uniref:hypothetical protein n=1 Tax=Mycobacteroides abscessus TaxID=36809 RepID=UPI0009D0093C|nr:hypothetical protein [Mycobacteroides abscessus]SLI43211.1 Uncharacterised protein [Mycobacteroides abscessus subsp. abscessus]